MQDLVVIDARAQTTARRGVIWALRRARNVAVVLASLSFALLAACSVKLVADYDADAAKSITDTSADVFAFYDKLIEASASAAGAKLAYKPYNEDWGRIETRMRVLLVREESRPMNGESVRITRTTLEFWEKYRAAHKAKDDYQLVLLRIHRDRFQRLFTAGLVAEKAKLLADPDSDPKLETD